MKKTKNHWAVVCIILSTVCLAAAVSSFTRCKKHTDSWFNPN